MKVVNYSFIINKIYYYLLLLLLLLLLWNGIFIVFNNLNLHLDPDEGSAIPFKLIHVDIFCKVSHN